MFFFFNDTATTEIYTLSLHDALPILKQMRGTPYLSAWRHTVSDCGSTPATPSNTATAPSRTRRLRSTSIVKRSEEHTLNSSHANISYAVFCLKKKTLSTFPVAYPYTS